MCGAAPATAVGGACAGMRASQQVAAGCLVSISLVKGHQVGDSQELEGRLRRLKLLLQLPR